jgi:tyrosyl-DNA phosphodiesterase 1
VGLRDWVSVIAAHNFDAVQAHLVCSVPGVFTGADMARYGHLRMRTLLSRLQPMPASFARPSLMAQFSSLGRTSDNWLYDQWMSSMMPPTSGASQPLPRQSKANQAKQARATLAERLFLVWPTVAFVRRSFHGYRIGLSLCGQRASFDLECVRHRLFKFEPQNESRRDITPHMKSYALFDGGGQGVQMPLAYYLMTSANLSKQAWGELQKEESQFVLKNFELGVLFLQSEVDALSTAPKRPLLASDRGADRATSLDVPLIVDCRALRRIQFVDGNDDEQPWAFDVQYRDVDRFGQTNQPVVYGGGDRFARRKN